MSEHFSDFADSAKPMEISAIPRTGKKLDVKIYPKCRGVDGVSAPADGLTHAGSSRVGAWMGGPHVIS